jgi:hypothetical protein
MTPNASDLNYYYLHSLEIISAAFRPLERLGVKSLKRTKGGADFQGVKSFKQTKGGVDFSGVKSFKQMKGGAVFQGV